MAALYRAEREGSAANGMLTSTEVGEEYFGEALCPLGMEGSHLRVVIFVADVNSRQLEADFCRFLILSSVPDEFGSESILNLPPVGKQPVEGGRVLGFGVTRLNVEVDGGRFLADATVVFLSVCLKSVDFEVTVRS